MDYDTATLLKDTLFIMKQMDDECDAVGYLVAHKLHMISMQQQDLFESRAPGRRQL